MVRSSAVFHSLLELNAAVVGVFSGFVLQDSTTPTSSALSPSTANMEALMDPNGPIEVVRIKDRVSEPMGSGYRDVLLNLRIKGIGCDMIMELQLHLKDIIALVGS